ncbi:MAG TPA: TM0106 family RecB-like putative nuclease [Candidatus Limnocylindria bacterium]|nr:TM0106 family RecB-like putative nuclease [Candidatus Limnocylindria bacterium]
MRLLDGELVSSPSDLNDFLACEHRVALRRADLASGAEAPEDDPALEILAQKGQRHEDAALAAYEKTGRSVTRIADGDGAPLGLYRAAAATRAAMERGDDVIYQAAFVHEGWSGRADFLVRVEVPSRLGGWSYEIADAKLAVREQAAFLVQLCLYARFVEAIQGTLPPRVRALLGNGDDPSYDPARFIAYVDAARERYLAALPRLDAAAVPDKVGACGMCVYAERCEGARRAVDHLAFVANIRRSQIARLRDAGVATVAALAAADPLAKPRGIGAEPYAALVRQARLQRAQRETGKVAYELLPPQEKAGFAILPAPDAEDVYFDMEGDPLYEPGAGLEYLFGAYTRAGGYVDFWGETREEERLAFERFVDWLVAHRRAHPHAHVYHYAPYEKTALRTLAMRHGTREDEVDELLRGEVLVDLYAVVRGAIAQSQESYSIKKLERFYGFHRDADVRKGDDSIVAFERYLAERDRSIRDDITFYNDEDCRSTAELHAWLLRLRDEAAAAFGETPFRAQVDPRVPSEAEVKSEAERTELERELLAGTPDATRRLLASLLSYHRREQKPVWWALYARYEAAAQTDFVADDDEALGGLVPSELHPPVPPTRKNGKATYTYTFPPQRHKLQPGSLRDPHLGKDGPDFEVVEIDETAGLVRVKRREEHPHPRALVPGGPIMTRAQEAALRRLAGAVLDGSAPARYPAALAIIERALPRIDGLVPGDRVQPPERDGAIDAADVAALALGLRESALVIQGPPGTGKTYTGARVIDALLAAGRRVGVMATSHPAIHNLLAAVETPLAARGAAVRAAKKCDNGRRSTQYASPSGTDWVENVGKNGTFDGYELVAGTSWLMAHEELAPLDVLVIDEAGQVSLADALAAATCARAVVLLGDPQQLAHVSLGTHPEGAGVSVLQHLVGEKTVAPERGVFLERSYRMHPELCGFVSDVVYEGRLRAAPDCAAQRIDAPWYGGAGLRYVPVEHAGNGQLSPEEAEAVAEIVAGVHGGTFTAADGTTRELTLADILVVAPYNAQVALLKRVLRERFGAAVRVGTVDKFQGQEAPVVIYSLAASSAEDAPRGADFLLEENRFNVAISRGRALAVLVCSPRILATPCTSVAQLRAAAAFCAYAQRATPEPCHA